MSRYQKTPSGWRVIQDPVPVPEAPASAPAVLPTEQREKATPVLGAPFEPSAAEAAAEEKPAAAAEAAVEAAAEEAIVEAIIEETIVEEAVVEEEMSSQKVQAAAFPTMVSHQVICFG